MKHSKVSDTVLGSERHWEKCNVVHLDSDVCRLDRHVSYVTHIEEGASKHCGLAGGRWLKARRICEVVQLDCRVSQRHSKLTAGLLPLKELKGLTLSGSPTPSRDSMLFFGDQFHTCSELAFIRNRTKNNIKESKDKVWEVGKFGDLIRWPRSKSCSLLQDYNISWFCFFFLCRDLG